MYVQIHYLKSPCYTFVGKFEKFGVLITTDQNDDDNLVLDCLVYIDHGLQIDENVAREIINHRSLKHPNIIRFKEASLFFVWLFIVYLRAVLGSDFDSVLGDPDTYSSCYCDGVCFWRRAL